MGLRGPKPDENHPRRKERDRFRERYATDLAFREKVLEQNRRGNEKRKSDPERAAHRKAW